MMRFAFTRCDTLPRLAWCPHLWRGSDVARVYHGPWVETRDDWFVEDAWTGPFEKSGLDNALFLVGSGGVVRAGRVRPRYLEMSRRRRRALRRSWQHRPQS